MNSIIYSEKKVGIFKKSISFRRDKVDFVELVSLMYILLLMKCVLEFNLCELKLSSFF
jgi:hypothetical protein